MSRWVDGIGFALLVLLACGVLFGCAKDQNKQADPKAFQMWVVPF